MLELRQRDDSDMKSLYVKVVSLCSVCVELVAENEQEPVPENTQEPVPENALALDLDNFVFDNVDALAPWERNAHIWINQQILSITNENYEQ